MSLIAPFQPLLPQKQHLSAIVAPPYDVLSEQDVRALTAGNPLNITHVTRAEVESQQTGTTSLARAQQNLSQLLSDELFLQQSGPAYLIYQISKGNHSQTGIVANINYDKQKPESIKRHEQTRPQKVAERAELMKQLGTQVSPVMLCYRNQAVIASMLENHCQQHTPDYTINDTNGYRHAIWCIDKEHEVATFEQQFARIDSVYVADGHHRVEAAISAQDSPCQILSVLFPHDELKLLGYHRLIQSSVNQEAASVLEKLGTEFELSRSAQAVIPATESCVGVYCEGQWYQLTLKPSEEPIAAKSLHQQIIEPYFGITDPRTDNRIAFVGGDDAATLIHQAVDSKDNLMAFTLAPTPAHAVLDTADAGGIMPPKSTWFEPKLLDGLFMAE